jgi:glycine betaine/proline transport system substrate-binding protein
MTKTFSALFLATRIRREDSCYFEWESGAHSPPLSHLKWVTLFAILCLGLGSCGPSPNPEVPEQPTRPTSEQASGQGLELPGAGVQVRGGDTGLLEARFVTEIVNIGLEKLGYEIAEPTAAVYPALFLAIADGELDYTAEYQYHIHAQYFDNAGGEEKLQRVGVLTPDVAKAYSIDRKTAEQYGITNLAQLQDPKLAQLFDIDGNGKANLIGCNPGWGCNLAIAHHLEAYNLQDTVEQSQGEYVALMADTITRYQQGESILYFAAPLSFVPSVLQPDQDVIQLEVPFTALPGDVALTENETSLNGKNVGFAVDQNIILANKAFIAANPAAQHWFELLKIPLEDFSAESLRIQAGENSPEEIRRHAEAWIEENQELFDRWIEDALKFGTNY